jgi:Flp pilus assembly protein TadG
MTRTALALIHRLRRDHSGNVAILAGVAMLAAVGVGAAVVDIGNVVNARRTLQASTDAAALAGAQAIAAGTAVATATTYATNNNNLANLTATMASGYPMLKCFTSIPSITCTGSPASNGIVVKQQASVPTYFAGVFGINSVSLSATAAAGAKGGTPNPLDVMIILDTTQSMTQADSSCSATRMDCAVGGVRALLTGFWHTADQVGLMVFPGLMNSTQAALEYDCNASTPSSTGIASYAATPVYQIVPLTFNYRSSNTAPLDTNENIVKAARGGASGCTQGMTAVGGKGTFYADAIIAAQNALTTTDPSRRANVQKVIILLGDGDANASAANMPTGTLPDGTQKKYNQCHQAIAAAQAARTAGIWVYSIAYTASTTLSCSTDSTANGSSVITACETMRQIAKIGTADFSKFYSSTNGCISPHSVTDMIPIFNQIGADMTSSRMLPDDAL